MVNPGGNTLRGRILTSTILSSPLGVSVGRPRPLRVALDQWRDHLENNRPIEGIAQGNRHSGLRKV